MPRTRTRPNREPIIIKTVVELQLQGNRVYDDHFVWTDDADTALSHIRLMQRELELAAGLRTPA